jgi:hypothetical protein
MAQRISIEAEALSNHTSEVLAVSTVKVAIDKERHPGNAHAQGKSHAS